MIIDEIKSNLEFEAFQDVEDFEYDGEMDIKIGCFRTEPVISYEATATDEEGNSFKSY